MIQKIASALLGLTVTAFASAGTPGLIKGCVPGEVSVPCEARHWNLGVQALYLRSVFGANHGYGITDGGSYRSLDSDWDWGFRLEGSYHFSTGNDITLTWMHYNVDNQHGQFSGVIPVTPVFSLEVPYQLQTENTFDQVNLIMGQSVDFGLIKDIRFYGGLQYADIRVDANNHFLSVPAPLPATITRVDQYHNTDFNGVGPVVGIDYAYSMTHGISLTANSAVSLLYGTGRFNEGYLYSNVLIPASAFGSKKMVVPGLEAKLGITYTHVMSDGSLNIEGGYQVINYFNALQTNGINSQPGFSDYGLYGPYLGVKWLGNA